MQAAGYWQAKIAYHARYQRDAGAGRRHGDAGAALPSRGSSPSCCHRARRRRCVTQEAPRRSGSTTGAPALSAPVEAANARIVALYAQNGQPFAKIDRPPRRRRCRDRRPWRSTYTIEPGPSARGSARPTITGLQRVDARFRHPPHRLDGRRAATTSATSRRRGRISCAPACSARRHHAMPTTPAPDGSVAMTIDARSRGRRARSAPASATTPISASARAPSGSTAISSARARICALGRRGAAPARRRRQFPPPGFPARASRT